MAVYGTESQSSYPLPLEEYSDGFKTTRVRIPAVRNHKSALLENFHPWNVGDSIVLEVIGIPGADPGSLRATVTSPKGVRLAGPADNWHEVPTNPGSFYTLLDLGTAELEGFLTHQQAGVPLPARLYVADDYVTWIDTEVEILASPHLGTGLLPGAPDPYARRKDVVLREALHSGLLDISTMPTLTAAQRELRVQTLINLLISATAPDTSGG